MGLYAVIVIGCIFIASHCLNFTKKYLKAEPTHDIFRSCTQTSNITPFHTHAWLYAVVSKIIPPLTQKQFSEYIHVL